MVLSSNSATVMPGLGPDIVAACEAGDEPAAVAAAEGAGPFADYPSTKLAWPAGSAPSARPPPGSAPASGSTPSPPGPTGTPMVDALGIDPLAIGDLYPVPIGRLATPRSRRP